MTKQLTDFIRTIPDYPKKGILFRDINNEMADRERILDQSERDQLTGLYNREFFYRYAEQYDQYHPGTAMDAVVIDIEPAKVFVSETTGLTILDESYTDEEYAAAIRKGNTALLDNLNAALAELKADGTLDAIVAKYISAE